jgi:aryl sulfotransferase
MKKNAVKSVPLGGAFWDAGAEVFTNQGVNGRWADVLTEDEVAEYEAKAVGQLGADCAHWLATGKELTWHT